MSSTIFQTWRPQRDLSVPVYLQICSWIEGLIFNQQVSPNTPLPSVPALAEQCGASALTVHKAYKRLKERGLVYAISGSGTFVAPVEQNRYVGLLIHREVLAAALASPTIMLHLDSLHDALSARGYIDRIILDNNPRRGGCRAPISADALALIEQPSMQGLIAITHEGSDELFDLIDKRGLPSIGFNVEHRDYTTVVELRQRDFVAEALRMIREQGLMDVAVMYYDDPEKINEHRVDHLNMLSGLFADNSLSMRPDWIIGVGGMDESGGYHAFNYIWSRPQRPRALIIVDDVVARSALNGIVARHVRVPDDLFVCALGNSGSPIIHPSTWARWEFNTQSACADIVSQFQRLESGQQPQKVISVVPQLVSRPNEQKTRPANGPRQAIFRTANDIMLASIT